MPRHPNNSAPPARNLDQRMSALARANQIRTYRAAVKLDLKYQRRTFASLLDDDLLATMKLFEALVAMPKVGRVKANRALNRCKVSPSKTIGGLSERQRVEILTVVG